MRRARMGAGRATSFGVLLGLLAFSGVVRAQPRLRAAPRGASPIVIDGRLDESAWRHAEVGEDFVERRPTVGARPPVETRFRVLVDADALYFGIRCGLAEGERPRGVTLARDSFEIFNDDALSIKLDVRHDRRNTVGFAVSAANTQLDYVAIDNGRQFRREYDAIWESATWVSDDAWFVEMRIPVSALGIDDREGIRILGLNVTRDHNATRGTYDWSAMPVQLGATSATHYGELAVEELRGGRPLVLQPFVLAGYREDDESRFPSGSPATLSAGGDARMRLGPDSWAELTLLTDFAQVDLDDPAINLDRFPLFFEERRPFFLTGLDVFEFGERSVAQPFFTRRIGLDEERNEVQMWGGLKLYGRSPLRGNRSLSYGLLNVLTGEEVQVSDTVARLRLNVGQASYVGALATTRYREGATRPDVTTGVDFVSRVAEGKLEVRGFASGVFNESPEDAEAVERGAAARLSVGWAGDHFRPSASLLWVGESFDPSTGFVRRRGVLNASTILQYQHRTRVLGLETFDVFLRATQELDDDLAEATERNLGRTAGGEMSLGWVNGWFVYVRADYDEKVVTEPFELVGVEVQPGAYRGVRALFGISRSSARNPSLAIDYLGESSFFGGVRQTLSTSVGVVVTRHLRFGVSGNASFLSLPSEASIETFAGSLTSTLTPSTRVQIDGAFQMNTVDRSLLSLARLRWRYLPGSDLFLVYRERRSYGAATGDPERALERRLILKVSLRHDLLL